MKKMGALIAAGLIATTLILPLRAQESSERRDEIRPAVKLKSEKAAMTIAVAGTLLPWAAYLGAALLDYPHDELQKGLGLLSALTIPIGPSWGYFYAGLPKRALLGTGLRVGLIAGLVIVGMRLHDAGHYETDAIFATGVAAVIGTYALDFAGLKKAVRKRNSRIQGASLNVAPVLAPKSKTVGLSLQLGW